MSGKRIIAIVLIYLLACAGWVVLGGTTLVRSEMFLDRLYRDVRKLWGVPLVQKAPMFTLDDGSKTPPVVIPSATKISTDVKLDYRRKGLIWYPTFVCRMDGRWTLTNDTDEPMTLKGWFEFPNPEGTYDNFVLTLDDQPLDVPVNPSQPLELTIDVPAGASRVLAIGYGTFGIESWRYVVNREVGRVKDLSLTVTTDFHEYDFPDGSMSPTDKKPIDGGAMLTWEASDLLTTQDMGVVVPDKLNPGPLAARITFFAPVCLVFFFVLVAAVNVVCRIGIHPMHYLFVSAGFFAFHLLFVYMVDHVDVHVAFAVAAAVSVVMVTLYLRAALGTVFPWKVAGAGQVFYLVLFSYSFFLQGMAGLTV
ncbi:MAG: inner membrane CreD family protein, partial [Planctomycetota bacterium]